MDGLTIQWAIVAVIVWLIVVIVTIKKLGGKLAVVVGFAAALAIGGVAIALGEDRCRTDSSIPLYGAPSGEPIGELADNTRVTIVEQLPSGWTEVEWEKDSEEGSGYLHPDDRRFKCS